MYSYFSGHKNDNCILLSLPRKSLLASGHTFLQQNSTFHQQSQFSLDQGFLAIIWHKLPQQRSSPCQDDNFLCAPSRKGKTLGVLLLLSLSLVGHPDLKLLFYLIRSFPAKIIKTRALSNLEVLILMFKWIVFNLAHPTS